MTLRYAILGLLEQNDLHGYRIKLALEERVGISWPVGFGQIYQTLKDLHRRGLIDGRFDRGPGHVGRWVYTITVKGRRAVETWLNRAPRAPEPARDEMLIRLLVLEHRDVAGSLRQIAAQAQTYRQYLTDVALRRRAVRATETSPALLSSLAADAVTFRVEAHLRWLAHCAEVLRAAHGPDATERTDAPRRNPVASTLQGTTAASPLHGTAGGGSNARARSARSIHRRASGRDANFAQASAIVAVRK